ncbi:stage III sporulation protein AF [Oceanobacillus caeni]|uniref:Stage III sporulation protein AF n=1 Tax=Oceanobacillus caeni TaxID=405946 RepID=A0ABR5MKP6_9BACI|nr:MULTISPECIES: stage III sporulation protein AF [Bacillaceae]KKE80659.1 stage III sporulation protein AF [Bacilli bacterium VT-13-104]PZD85316.1 stage III sporulation protein AF [Bacilli bacterium]KPH76409.1 stage III sporulation protein AF [Oceanobacillus caeni]MBU8789823.1 stage III sporulation protein AF [Oceanobacillus caeni]MCR1834933.1 stage III sporulation protein AF [Oceanobacillus caeni]
MDIVINWVTQIILFIVLATIIDLLIPTSSMNKYIKLVVGLILILILLKPIFYVLNIDMETALNKSFQQVNDVGEDSESVKNLIEFQKKEIQSTQDAYILEQMAVQLIEIAEDPMKEKYQQEITNIEFKFNSNDSYSYEDLEEVIVYVKDLVEEEGEQNTVENVVINTDHVVEKKDMDRHDEEIKQLLKKVWELTDKEITIYWEGGAS